MPQKIVIGESSEDSKLIYTFRPQTQAPGNRPQWRPHQDIEVPEGIHSVLLTESSVLHRFICFNSEVMPVIPRLFAIMPATILKPTIRSTSPMPTTQRIPNNPYIVQFSLFTCLI